MRDIDLIVAGEPIAGAEELVRRYCSLDRGEVWAYRYYDAVPVEDPRRVGPVDVLAASTMHGPIRRADLQWFHDHADRLAAWLDTHPPSTAITELTADEALDVGHGLAALTGDDGPGTSLLTKVLHRHRPSLVAIDERDIGRRYARHLGQRGRLPYPDLLVAVRHDLVNPPTAAWLQAVSERLRHDGVHLTALRILDVAVWMDANGRAA